MDLAGCETMLKTEVGIYKRKQESKKKRKKEKKYICIYHQMQKGKWNYGYRYRPITGTEVGIYEKSKIFSFFF